MEGTSYEVRAVLWVHSGAAAWHFVTLPAELADEIRARYEGSHRPFGSLAVRATIGSTTWATSLFADGKSGSYLLPVKAEVRRSERLEAGDEVAIGLALTP